MKLSQIVLIAALSAGTQIARAEPPVPTVVVEAVEVKSLAAGYARAFSSLRTNGTSNIITRRDGKLFTLVDVRSLDAFDGVLVAVVGRDKDTFVINPKDIVFMTDGKYTVKE